MQQGNILSYACVEVIKGSPDFARLHDLDDTSVRFRLSVMVPRYQVVIAGCAAPSAGGGDFWHVATAHILCAEFAALGADVAELVCLIGTDVRGETRYIKLRQVRLVHEYLRNIGMRCVLAKFDIGNGDGETHIAYEDRLFSAMARLSQAEYSAMFANQDTAGEESQSCWQSLWDRTGCTDYDSCVKIEPSMIDESSYQHPYVLGMLPHNSMTTIISNCFHTDLPWMDKRKRFATIRRRLSGDPQIKNAAFITLADRKMTELRSLIGNSCVVHNIKKPKTPFVILILYRKGTVNFRQDTSETIFEQIHSTALNKGFVPIRVAVGLTIEEIEASDLDLFDVRRSDKLVDKRFIARFWSLVSNMEEIFGVIGGRTGSLDVAAFQGVNSFSWDEPMLEIVASPRHPQLKQIYSPTYLHEQYWQQLNLFQMLSIHTIDVLDPESYDAATGRFQTLRIIPLKKWLSGEKWLPSIPATQQSVSHVTEVFFSIYSPSRQVDLIERACRTRLENRAVGMTAYNMRQLQERLRHQINSARL